MPLQTIHSRLASLAYVYTMPHLFGKMEARQPSSASLLLLDWWGISEGLGGELLLQLVALTISFSSWSNTFLVPLPHTSPDASNSSIRVQIHEWISRVHAIPSRPVSVARQGHFCGGQSKPRLRTQSGSSCFGPRSIHACSESRSSKVLGRRQIWRGWALVLILDR